MRVHRVYFAELERWHGAQQLTRGVPCVVENVTALPRVQAFKDIVTSQPEVAVLHRRTAKS